MSLCLNCTLSGKKKIPAAVLMESLFGMSDE